jgi:hypothetical protein
MVRKNQVLIIYNDLSEDDEVPEQYASLHEETLG